MSTTYEPGSANPEALMALYLLRGYIEHHHVHLTPGVWGVKFYSAADPQHRRVTAFVVVDGGTENVGYLAFYEGGDVILNEHGPALHNPPGEGDRG